MNENLVKVFYLFIIFIYLYVNLCLPWAEENVERTEIAHITANFSHVKHNES